MGVGLLISMLIAAAFVRVTADAFAGGVKLDTELLPEPPLQFHLIHIAKTAGRTLKHLHDTLRKQSGRSGRPVVHKGNGSPFVAAYGHKMRARDIELLNGTAVVVIRDVVERFESAFTFVRTGGFGVRLEKGHGLHLYNTSDALVADLRSSDPEAVARAREALRCDSKLRYCPAPAPTPSAFSLNQHVSIEFRPQVWWLNHMHPQALRLICFPDLHKVFPTVKWRDARANQKRSMKGYTHVSRAVQNPENVAFLRHTFYKTDSEVYAKYCGGVG